MKKPPTTTQPKPGKKAKIGFVMSVLAVLPFVPSAIMKFTGSPQLVEGWNHFAWPANMVIPIAIIEAASVVLYLIPRFSVLGAILLTGYLGGAMATHLRLGEPVVMHVILGILVWGGLYLRDARLRELIPFRKPSA